MGASQQKQQKIDFVDLSLNIYQNKMAPDQSGSKNKNWKFERIFEIIPFERLSAEEVEKIVAPENIYDHFQEDHHTFLHTIYFSDLSNLKKYVSNIFNFKQLCDIPFYDSLEINSQKLPYSVQFRRTSNGNSHQIQSSEFKENVIKCLDLLIFVAKMLEKTKNLYFEPLDIWTAEDKYFLTNFSAKEYSKFEIILGYISWSHELYNGFEEGIINENLRSSFEKMSIYIKEICETLKCKRINDHDLLNYLQKVREKAVYLSFNVDSFHACFISKKHTIYHYNKEWILAKRNNQVYFVNIQDEHCCQGKIIRKKKRIDIEARRLVFDPEEMEVKFVMEDTKLMVKASQFDLDEYTSISDLEIKHKFPIKMKNPFTLMNNNKQIYFLQQMVYRYDIESNTVHQDSKKINDYIYLASNSDFNFLIIQLSIDIFRNGIRIYINDKYKSLVAAGNQFAASDIENIRVDIKNIDFCIQVYRGVYVMLANKNLWILDLNFDCFFSFVSTEKIKSYSKVSKNYNSNSQQYMFDIINQPFSVKFLPNHEGINAFIEADRLYIIGTVMQKLYFLQYQFIFEAGVLKYLRSKPLFTQSLSRISPQPPSHIAPPKTTHFHFNVYNENLDFYKTTQWIYKGHHFLTVQSFDLSISKASIEITLNCEEAPISLKDCIQQLSKMERKWSNFQVIMILHKILTIYEYIFKNQITHRNISVSTIYITEKRELKLIGWSEPQKNWHISDFKDFLLTCFNIITRSVYDKINDKLLQKHENQLIQFSPFSEKLHQSMRNKNIEKKVEIEKSLTGLKEFLNRQISSKLEHFTENLEILSFQFNTPRFSIVNITNQKIKKLSAKIQNNNGQEFTFKSLDKFVWDQENKIVTIFTATYQMFEARISANEAQDEVIGLEEYEYLPNNIVDSSFIHAKNAGLYSFGGVFKSKQGKLVSNFAVFKFNRQKLTWDQVCHLSETRINPKLTQSQCKRYIYVVGGRFIIYAGDCDQQNSYFQMTIFDTVLNTTKNVIDPTTQHPLHQLSGGHSLRIFQICSKDKIYLIWSLSNNSYQIKIFSSKICGFEFKLEGKIYLEENCDFQDLSITFKNNAIHFLRPYGKYTKIEIEKMEQLSLVSKTLYSN